MSSKNILPIRTLFFIITITISIITKEANETNENIKTLLEKSKKHQKFYRHSGIEVIFNENDSKFKCIIKEDRTIYNLPSFILPNNRLICDFLLKRQVKSNNNEMYNKIREVLDEYALKDKENHMEDLNFGRKFNNLYKSICNHIEISAYLSLIDQIRKEGKDLTEVIDLIDVISLFTHGFHKQFPSVLSLSSSEISYIQKGLFKLNLPHSHISNFYNVIDRSNSLISSICKIINVTKEKLTSIFSFVQSKAIKFSLNKLLNEETISEIELNDEETSTSTTCLNESVLFCNFSGKYSRFYTDKYRISTDQLENKANEKFRIVLSTNNDVMNKNEEYLFLPYSIINDDLKFDFYFENLVFRRIFNEEMKNIPQCNDVFNGNSSMEDDYVIINKGLISICNLVGVEN